MLNFAPEVPRDHREWLMFNQRDQALRKQFVPEGQWEGVIFHPAKMNLYVALAVLEYVTKPPQTILDPFGGVGTTMIAAHLTGNKSVLVDVEEVYVKTAEAIREHNGWPDLIIREDNRRALPFPADHILTSPPYGADLYRNKDVSDRAVQNREGAAKGIEGLKGDITAQYAAHNQNMGKLNPFLYVQEMKKLYVKMVASIPVGGTITITHRDRMKQGERVVYALEIIKALKDAGMRLELWERWLPPGSIQQKVNQSQGLDVVEEEDILMFRKPEVVA